MSLEVTAFASSDIGRRRKRNEDSFVIAEDVGLYAVADGMGGHNAGDVASQRAVAAVAAALRDNVGILKSFAADPTPALGASAALLVEMAIQTACADIHAAGEADARYRGMGTTFVGLVVAGERAIVAHVGDSRLYLQRSGAFHVLTEDHTLVAEQIRAGDLEPANAGNSPFKGVLTRALGQHESVQVDTLVVDTYPGDTFLLCSDGLYAYLSDEELGRATAAVTAELPASLVAIANERGGRDNITALVVKLSSEAAETMVGLPRIEVLRRIPLFEHLSYREASEVLAIATTRQFHPGATIVREGAPGAELFVLLDGEVSVERAGAAIAVLGPGGHFGEMGLVDAGPRSASVLARSEVRAMILHRDAMLTLMQRDQGVAVKLLWAFVQVLSQRLRVTNTELSDALQGPATTRIA